MASNTAPELARLAAARSHLAGALDAAAKASEEVAEASIDRAAARASLDDCARLVEAAHGVVVGCASAVGCYVADARPSADAWGPVVDALLEDDERAALARVEALDDALLGAPGG